MGSWHNTHIYILILGYPQHIEKWIFLDMYLVNTDIIWQAANEEFGSCSTAKTSMGSWHNTHIYILILGYPQHIEKWIFLDMYLVNTDIIWQAANEEFGF